MSHRPATVAYVYRFRFEDGAEREFALQIDEATLALRATERKALPSWTRLGYFQCSNCPLREEHHPRCPIAVNLVDVVEFFRERSSVETVEVEVEARGRTYRKRTALQEGLSALVGVVMVTSGCPVLDRLRPMVATHLPFMSGEESTYRIVSMYLMAQLFIAREGGEPDWELTGLVDFLGEIRRANVGFTGRLGSLRIKDASLNAVSTLSALGELTSLNIVEGGLDRWRRLFRAALGRSE
jgi:hypothetical protein